MRRHPFCALLLALVLPGLAVADPPEPLPSFETLTVVRGIEWGSYYDQLKLTLTRQSDGTYLASITGEDYKAADGLTVQEADLVELKRALWAMRSFSSGTTFAGEGNHWYTEVKLDGKQPDGKPFALDLWFFDSNSRSVSEKVGKLEDAARKLIEKLISPAPAPAPAPATGGMAGALGAGS